MSDIKSRFIEEGITFTERKLSVKSLNVRDLPEKQKKLLDKLEEMTKNSYMQIWKSKEPKSDNVISFDKYKRRTKSG